MKKILMVCEAFGGGVFTYVTQLCNDMCNNFEIYLVYSLRAQTPLDFCDFLDKKICLIKISNLGNLKNLINNVNTINKLQAIEREIKPDIIHLHSSIAGGLGRIAYRSKANIVVYTPHGYAHILMGKSIKSSLYKLMEKFLGRINALTLTCCESENTVAKTLCRRTAYIETGVNLVDLSTSLASIESIKSEKFTVYSLGRVCKQKQPLLFNKIAKLVPEARFLWIGGGELEHLLSATNLEVTGWKPRKEALAIAKGANVFILCSLGEAVAMSLIENMYIKKLCLVSNTMGNKSVIQDGLNGYVCKKAEEYAMRINDAMHKYPENLTVRAYQDVISIYNTDVMKEKYIKFYNSL